MQKGLLSAVVFLVVAAGAVSAWYVLWEVTGSHEAATALFTALAFAAAATALYFQHRAIVETKGEVGRTARALEGAREAQVVQAALLEHSTRLTAALAEASTVVGRPMRRDAIAKAHLTENEHLQRRLRQVGASRFLEPDARDATPPPSE